MTNSASIPAKAKMTAAISLLLGFRGPKKHSNVETIMTPPVTIGNCTDASTCARAMTSNRFAI